MRELTSGPYIATGRYLTFRNIFLIFLSFSSLICEINGIDHVICKITFTCNFCDSKNIFDMYLGVQNVCQHL
jgi:hypothetical protein